MVSARIQSNRRNVAAYIGAGIIPGKGAGVPSNTILIDGSPLIVDGQYIMVDQ